PSPYFPSSRGYRNPIYLRIEEVPGAAARPADLERLAGLGRALNADRRIDRDRAFRPKLEAPEPLWPRFDGDPAFQRYCAADGADAWAWQDMLALGMSVGAPPDDFSPHGQDWGLPPLIPHRLRGARYEPFIQTIRAALRHAGGLRIDHVMGLFRLFWIPRGM